MECLDWCPYLLLGIVSYKNGFAELLILHLLPLLNPWLIIEMQPVQVFLQVLLWQMFILTGSTSSIPYSRERSTRYSDRLHDISVTVSGCYKNVYVNSFFPCTTILWNSLPIECFALSYDLNGCTSTINRHLLTAVFY